MGGLKETLGFDPIKFIFTIVNFLVFFWILKRFLFKPLLKSLGERKKKVEEGLEKAAQADSVVANAKKEAESIIASGKEEARRIVQEAEKEREALLKETQAKIDEMIKEAHEMIEKEKEKIRLEMESQMIELVSVAVNKVLYELLSEEEQRVLVEKAVSEALVETY